MEKLFTNNAPAFLMGSLVSGIVANIFMENLESRAVATFPHQLHFWRRYIDDICAALPSGHIPLLLEHLNSMETTIQFTCEYEEDHKFPCLEILLELHDNGTITTSVYRKSMAVGQYLHYDSSHPRCIKSGIVKSLFRRTEAYCSSPEILEVEKNKIRLDLIRNGYPQRLISNIERNISGTTVNDDRQWAGFCCIPYIRGTSEAIRRALGSVDVRVTFLPDNTIRKLLCKPKDPVPVGLTPIGHNNVVYCVPCVAARHFLPLPSLPPRTSPSFPFSP